MMNKDRVLLSRSLKQLEKELYKTANLFDNLDDLSKSLSVIEKQAANLEGLIDQNPKLADVLKSEIKDKEVIKKFREVGANLDNLKKLLNNHVEPGFKTDLFLENFRSNASYVFSNFDDSISFVRGVISETKEKRAYVGPRMLGTIDLEYVAKKSPAPLRVLTPKLLEFSTRNSEKILGYLRNGGLGDIYLDVGDNIIVFTSTKSVLIKSNPDFIKSFDRLSRLIGGDILH